MTHRTALLALVFGCIAAPAFAQSDPVAMAHQMVANQLGLVQYCQKQGYAGDDAVAAERSALANLPASSVSTTDAETLGQDGTMLVPGGTKTSLSSMASSHNGTVETMCKQMASAAIQVMAAMKQQGITGANGMPTGTMNGMPAMPSMNGMPAMPTMNGMPSMPTMNGMPGLPGAAPAK